MDGSTMTKQQYPPPPPPRPGKFREQEEEWSAERIRTVAMETLSWCTKQYKSVARSDQVGVPYFIVGVMMVTGFALLGLVAALPTKGRAVMVNTWGFLLPAIATIGEVDQAQDRHSKQPSTFTGYWVSYHQNGHLTAVRDIIILRVQGEKTCLILYP